MDLQNVMRRFIALDYSLAWGGPRHPEYPNTFLVNQVARLWETYPSLKQDDGFVEFIEMYAGAIIIYPDNSVDVGINGLWDYTCHLLDMEGTNDGDYLIFSEILFSPRMLGEIHGIAFAFNLIEPSGIYRKVSLYEDIPMRERQDPPYEAYCGTFIEWLDRLVLAQGRLID